MGLFGRKRQFSFKQRLERLRKLKEEARLMQEEHKQLQQIETERKEIKRLQEEVHPSKRKRLLTLLGRVEHGGEKAGRAFLRGEAKF